jgi:hypothetical protein
VLESPTAFSERDVLNCLLLEGAAAGALAFSEAASSMAAWTRVREGFWVVRNGEDSTCGVMRSERVCCVTVEVDLESDLRARRELALEAAIAYVYVIGNEV